MARAKMHLTTVEALASQVGVALGMVRDEVEVKSPWSFDDVIHHVANHIAAQAGGKIEQAFWEGVDAGTEEADG